MFLLTMSQRTISHTEDSVNIKPPLYYTYSDIYFAQPHKQFAI